jgi:opacity protein-like surface antigen
MPKLGVVLTDEMGAGLLSGNLEASLGMKYKLLSFERWMSFWDAGVGVLWTDLAPRIVEDSSQGNFVLQTGPGVQSYVTTRMAVTVGVRYHHDSNAGIGERNLGMDAVLPYAGASWMLSH